MPDGDETVTMGPGAESGQTPTDGVEPTIGPVATADAAPGSTEARSPGGAQTAAPVAAAPPLGSAWAGELSDRVIDGVAWVKARTTVRALTALRAVVYGLVVVVALVTALVLLALGFIRMWDAYLPLSPLGRRVWLGYIVLGGAAFLVGTALLVRKKAGGHDTQG